MTRPCFPWQLRLVFTVITVAVPGSIFSMICLGSFRWVMGDTLWLFNIANWKIPTINGG